MDGPPDDTTPAPPPAPAKRRRGRRRRRPDEAPAGDGARPAANAGGASPQGAPRTRDGAPTQGTPPAKRSAPPGPVDRALAALRELGLAVQALAAEDGLAPGGRLPVAALDVTVTVPMGGGGGREQLRADALALVETLRGRTREVLRGAVAFREGHVYCFFSDQAESPHSQPPDPTSVFAGYAANGKPEWRSFPNLCLARGEERVDRLYADPPEVIAIVQGAEELSGALLPGFGQKSRAYAVLGQVVVGLVPRSLDLHRRDGERVALTLQLVETTQDSDGHRLRLNVLGLLPEEIAVAAADADERSPAEAFRKVLRLARQHVDVLGRQLALAARRREPIDRDALVRLLLGRLRTDLLRVLKVRSFRTQHAEDRHLSGERPTGVALQDARAASDLRLFADAHRQTVIVVGPKQRAHVFTTNGRHVTSLTLEPGEAERKAERHRWRPLDPAAAQAFRAALERDAAG